MAARIGRAGRGPSAPRHHRSGVLEGLVRHRLSMLKTPDIPTRDLPFASTSRPIREGQ